MADLIPTAEEVQPTSSPASSPPGPSQLPAAFRSLKHRNFQLFFSGQLISLVGTWMQSIAEAWLIYRLTGSSVLLGLLGFVSQIPIFLLSPIGGLAADRWPRLGVVNAFDVPARQSFLIEMVGREDLLNAIALNSTMFNGARVAGPAVAGLVVAQVGEGWCFFLNGVSYIAVIAGLLMMRIEKPLSAHDGNSPIEKLREGLRFVRHAKPIRALLLLLGLVSFAALPFSVLMPIFADRILHGGASAYGNLMGAVGLGAMFGAFTLAMRQQLRGLGSIVAYSAIGLGVSLTFFGASRFYLFSLVALTLAGYAMMMQFTSANTLIQAMVPDQLRGRVMSLYSMMFIGMAPIGSLVAGKMAQHIGAPSTVALGGFASLVGGVVFAVKWPSMRAPARELVAAQGMMQPQPPPEINSQ